MAWGDLSSTQWVSFTNMQTSGIPLKSGQSHTTSNEWMTKAEAIAKYSVNTANSYLAAKSSNQWVAKRDLETGDPATATLYVYHQNGQWYGELSAIIPSASVIITEGNVLGWYDECIGAADELANMYKDLSPGTVVGFSIPAGSASAVYTSDTGLSYLCTHYKMTNSVKIDDTSRANGDTFYVGATLVTLSIPIGCTPYSAAVP